MARLLPGLRMTEKRGEVHGLLLRFLRAWYGLAPMTFTGSFLHGCMVCSCALSMGVMPVVAASPAADSAAVQKLAHSLKARVGMAAVMLDTGEAVAVGDETAYPMQLAMKLPSSPLSKESKSINIYILKKGSFFILTPVFPAWFV